MERERGSAARKKGGRPGGKPAGKGGKRARKEKKSDYFLKPGKQGAVSVLRRPIGNRIEPKLCGTMPTHALAVALVNQLERAESVVKDLFLEATDDGIEALEAILRACRESVERRGARQQQKKHGGGGAAATPGQPSQPKHLPRGERGRRHPGGEQPAGVAATDLGEEEETDPYAPAPTPSAGVADATNGAAAEGRRPRRRQGRRRRSGGGRPNGGDGGSDANGAPGAE